MPQRVHAVATAKRPGQVAAAAPALAEMGQLRDRMCKGTDRACVDGTSKEMTVWATAHAKSGLAEKMAAAETKLAKQIGEEIAECTTRALARSHA